jgi:hypothetical protein
LLNSNPGKFLLGNVGNIYGDLNILKLIQVGLLNSGLRSWIEPDHSAMDLPYLRIVTREVEKGYFAIPTSLRNGTTVEEYLSTLKPKAREVIQFLIDNDLECEEITSVRKVKEIDCGDLSVPDGNTLTYNGFVTHNTFGYATLYGSGAGTIREQLANDGIFYSVKEVTALINSFYSALDDVKSWIDNTHKQVESKGYTQTPLGRRRYFDIAPKWKTNLYQISFRYQISYSYRHLFPL